MWWNWREVLLCRNYYSGKSKGRLKQEIRIRERRVSAKGEGWVSTVSMFLKTNKRKFDKMNFSDNVWKKSACIGINRTKFLSIRSQVFIIFFVFSVQRFPGDLSPQWGLPSCVFISLFPYFQIVFVYLDSLWSRARIPLPFRLIRSEITAAVITPRAVVKWR